MLKKEKALNTEEKAILTRGNALLLIVPFPFSSSYFGYPLTRVYKYL